MSQVIYRKFRPQTFEEVLGQDHITQILKNQIKNHKISHAYLFSGSRGTGKTSCAKIFAKAVNCLQPVEGSPCNICENCRMIQEERTFDIVEMDAASNRRIDDIREIIENVTYPPSNVKYKVFIIDEAHMITREGFNALLKVMEEPPSHVVFILATTEMERIPETVLSRTQRYEFKRITKEAIRKNIEKISGELGIKITTEAIDEISTHSDGAMRDALSLFDQLVSLGKTEITTEDVESALGIVSTEELFNLVNFLKEGNGKEALNLFHELLEQKAVDLIIDELVFHYRNLLLGKYQSLEYRPISLEDKNQYLEQGEKFTVFQLEESLKTLLETQEKMNRASHPEIMAEAALLRLQDPVDFEEALSKVKYLEEQVQALQQALKDLTQKFLPQVIDREISKKLSEGNVEISVEKKKSVEKEEEKSQKTENSQVKEEISPNLEKEESKEMGESSELSLDLEEIKEEILETTGGMSRAYLVNSTFHWKKSVIMIEFKTEQAYEYISRHRELKDQIEDQLKKKDSRIQGVSFSKKIEKDPIREEMKRLGLEELYREEENS